jgi:hypothetical protein
MFAVAATAATAFVLHVAPDETLFVARDVSTVTDAAPDVPTSDAAPVEIVESHNVTNDNQRLRGRNVYVHHTRPHGDNRGARRASRSICVAS